MEHLFRVADRGRRTADEKLAAELAAGKTVRDAATNAGVSERTAFRRLEGTAFKACVAELRSEMVHTAAGRLASTMAEAADVLRAGLSDSDANIRHKSAVKLIELSVKVGELAEPELRVEELEQMILQKEQLCTCEE